MNEICIDMRGYNVVYNQQWFTCLQICPYREQVLTRGGFTYHDVEMLQVVVINQARRVEILYDMSCEFQFVKGD
jgi:hypothetical protein